MVKKKTLSKKEEISLPDDGNNLVEEVLFEEVKEYKIICVSETYLILDGNIRINMKKEYKNLKIGDSLFYKE